MLLDFFLTNVWAAIGLWAVFYALDYLLTLKAARLYETGVKNHIAFGGGYELNPVFQKDIAALRRFSYRFFLLLILFGGLLVLIYALGMKEMFAFSWGLLIGVQLTIHLRHIRNLAVFGYAQRSEGMMGKIEYEHWLSLRLSSVELLAYSGFFLFLYLLCSNFFVLGCAVGCFMVGWRHLIDSKKKPGQLLDHEKASTQGS
jgi:hypothetical protein